MTPQNFQVNLLNYQTYLYNLIKRKNPTSAVLDDQFWAKTADMTEPFYKELKLLLAQNHVSECEMLIKNHVQTPPT